MKAVWFLVKFFAAEEHADEFLNGKVYLNRLSYFKQMEAEEADGRPDRTEAVMCWWQPNDLTITITVPELEQEITITKADLAGPVSMSADFHNHLHLFCTYAVYTDGFEIKDGQIDCEIEREAELLDQIHVDERCFKFGKFAVIIAFQPFIERIRSALTGMRHHALGKLVDYYDEATFHGEIAAKEIPFKKQKAFSYQREFRIAVNTETLGDDPLILEVGSLADFSVKVEASKLNELMQFKKDYYASDPLTK